MKSAQSKPTPMRRHRSQLAATDSPARLTRRVQRAGFTLVELLMVILIIGILVSMLAVAINPVLTTSREFAVTQEMKQMDLAIESFKTKYGFYPPSFTGFVQAPNMEAQLLPFLNKISATHGEMSVQPGTSQSRLRYWWNHYGLNLDDRGSLIFWLSGLGANKQFPITGNLDPIGGNAQLPVIFAADIAVVVNAAGEVQGDEVEMQDAMGNPVSLEREAIFDFRGAQLSREFFDYDSTGNPVGLVDAPAGIRVYNSPYGNAKFDLAYHYRNSAFYADPQGTAGIAFHVNTDGGPVFPNPRTFQLSTFGLDGRAASSVINKPSGAAAAQWQEFNSDNIANFAAGRLDGFDWTEAVELGNRNPE